MFTWFLAMRSMAAFHTAISGSNSVRSPPYSFIWPAKLKERCIRQAQNFSPEDRGSATCSTREVPNSTLGKVAAMPNAVARFKKLRRSINIYSTILLLFGKIKVDIPYLLMDYQRVVTTLPRLGNHITTRLVILLPLRGNPSFVYFLIVTRVLNDHAFTIYDNALG